MYLISDTGTVGPI